MEKVFEKRSFKFCLEETRLHAKNFYFGLRLLPKSKRAAAAAIYCWMRRLDDLADSGESPADRSQAIKNWWAQTKDALERRESHVDDKLWAAFLHTVENFKIPSHLFLEAIEGALMDQEKLRYESFEELDLYCYRVASVVGLICLKIFGLKKNVNEKDAEELGAKLGTAFQLTNILRDVGEDAERGRIYLPREELRKYALTENDILKKRQTQAMRALFKTVAVRAEDAYFSARPLQELVSPDARPTLKIMTEIYHDLLNKIVAKNFNVFSERVALSLTEKITTVAKHLLLSMRVALTRRLAQK